ncbi:hypothetical protein J4573_17870 [Actinomadura barringtoniae]|uniref:Integral membrane protein n=1 Tax=Actinomadura barringtoniae TaxID=1427535 RepID=A0A939TAE2_9ACTN|nr:hypothetical protein [Actinomadura barringtoniae]MBO2448975.1 hypothetical protein [Actinomadura barringtoniae]
MSAWFDHQIVDGGRLRLFVFFVFMIGAFAFIRFSTRMIRAQVKWWPGNVTPGGVHIHHVVFGLVFMCVGGIGGLAVEESRSGWAALGAAVFGIGTGLVLDEFALVLRLDDVYWKEQGRLSVDAIFVAIALSGLALLGFGPLDIGAALTPGPDGEQSPVWAVVILAATNLALALITLLKGKIWTGLFGMFIPLLGFVGAIRLARPGAPWARWRYREGSRKLARAQRRDRRLRAPLERFKVRVQDLVAGRPDQPS